MLMDEKWSKPYHEDDENGKWRTNFETTLGLIIAKVFNAYERHALLLPGRGSVCT